MRKKSSTLVVLLLVLVISAMQGNKEPKGSIPTKGVFDDSETYKIKGDGAVQDLQAAFFRNTVYEHDVDGISSFLSPPIDLGRSFQINLNFSHKPERYLNFDFGAPVDDDATEPVPSLDLFQGFFAVQSVPECPSCVTDTRASFVVRDQALRIQFNPTYGGDLVQVSQIDPNSWEVRTKPGQNDVAALVRIESTKDTVTTRVLGRFHMPFRMRIIKKSE